MDFSDILYDFYILHRRPCDFLAPEPLANLCAESSRIVNLAVGVFMILGGISQFFPSFAMYGASPGHVPHFIRSCLLVLAKTSSLPFM